MDAPTLTRTDPLRACAALQVPADAELADALRARATSRVECAIGDLGPLVRGKIVAASDFVAQRGCRLPSLALGLTVTGREPPAVFGPVLPPAYTDIRLVPAPRTLATASDPRHPASVICEPSGPLPAPRYGRHIDAAELSPRAALRRILERLDAAGYRAVVAPELEFFLVERASHDPERIEAPAAASCARERVCEAYSLERTTQFAGFFDALYAACERFRIPISGHAHEAALSQYEVNFHPGEPLAQADAVFRFKRLVRELARRCGFLATFAAKPFLDQPGTGMHWHLSLHHRSGGNAFVDASGRDAPALGSFVAGLQRDADAAMALYAPYEMSFERIRRSAATPTRATWGREDRTHAFRVPGSLPQDRRIENRLPGGDANPYLALAVLVGTGWCGLDDGLPATEEGVAGPRLPRTLADALAALARNERLRALLGDPLVDVYVALKQDEDAQRSACREPRREWDLAHLLELA